MNAPENIFLPDVQASADIRNITIQKVGVKSIKHPLHVIGKSGQQATIANIDMTVMLPGHVKGTHMSRFLEVLQANHAALNFHNAKQLLAQMLQRLDSTTGHIKLTFPYFVEKTAPVSGVKSLLDYEVSIHASLSPDGFEYELGVQVPVTSLCPCSKEISQYGAHNQRSHILIKAQLTNELCIEDLIEIAESSASCELWGLLKRPDEKYVTEKAYENPKFVEDLVRDIAISLNQIKHINGYEVSSENFESIHNHSAYAWIKKEKN